MLVTRFLSRIPRTSLAQGCTSLFVSPSHHHSHLHSYSILSNQFHAHLHYPDKELLLNPSFLGNSSFQRYGLSSSPSSSSQPTGKGTGPPENRQGSTAGSKEPMKANEDAKNSDEIKEPSSEEAKAPESGSNSQSKAQSAKRRRKVSERTAFSDSDSESELSREDLVKLVVEKEEQLKVKHKELQKMQDKVLRTYADMENVMDRTKREAENSKKFAVQSFAKSLLDVADNLGRASSHVKENLCKIEDLKDGHGAVQLLKTLLEGVEMTDKQLAEVFKKFGIEKFDPLDEQFDPNKHNAAFEMPDASKPPGSVATVLKSGYMLYERVIRPAEVGVTRAVDNAAEQGAEA